MAYLYRRKDSPYFWIRYRDEHGLARQVSTGCRVGVAPEVKLARQMRAEKEVIEFRSGQNDHEAGWTWVPNYLSVQYQSRPATFERYRSAWSNVLLFITQKEIQSPQHFLRKHCYEYLVWRREPDKKNGKYRACNNTALLELKTLRVVMQEALQRGMISANPCVRLGIKKERPKEKPELSAEDCATIRAAIPNVSNAVERRMLENSFEIARHQGCRLSETRLDPMTDVDLAGMTIRFRSAKGGKDFVTRLHPGLIPLFTRLQADRQRFTWSVPEGRGRQWASATWWDFLDDLGLKAKGVTFHSTRVTVVTELARGNVHESKAQAFVGHASTTVHMIYQRLRPADLSDCTEAVGQTTPASSKSGEAPAT